MSDLRVDWALGGWKQSRFARSISNFLGVDTDGWYGAQCKDFINAYFDTFTGWMPPGNAINLATCALPPSVQRIRYTQGMQVEPGDVFVENRGRYGHTGIIILRTAGGWVSIDQNWYNANDKVGSPPGQVNHSFALLNCILRIVPGKGGSMNYETMVDQLLNAAGVNPDHSPTQADVNQAVINIDKKNKDFEGQKAAADERKAFVDGVVKRLAAVLGVKVPNEIGAANALVDKMVASYIGQKAAADTRYEREKVLAKTVGAKDFDDPEVFNQAVSVMTAKTEGSESVQNVKLSQARGLAQKIVDIK